EDRRKSLADVRGTNPLSCEADAAVIAAYLLRQYDPGPTRVLLSGGEPAQQPLRLLVDALHDAGYQVHLETSGTATGHLGASVDWICLSPKIGMPGGLSLARAACEVADELTWPIGKEKDLRQLRAFLVEMALKPNCVVGIQPLSQNSKATTLCIEACLRHGWRLSVQTHKYLELR
ncbi:MAG: 7-carboxy-7-deazaguanine synthase QueE, partial [Candidatus Latescibacteria bacterium]|nr:7-carboxy-7-deazaguanine synthase QueE [Candidatus Latescibacterota bacterium]